jgi:hypothetical protein
LGAGSVDLTATAVAGDPNTTVAGGEWFVGPAIDDPGEGNATAMSISGTGPWDLSATIDVSTWPVGTYTLNVRAVDPDGTWGAAASTELVVSEAPDAPDLFFSTTGTTPIPGLGAPFDDSNIYGHSGTSFSLEWDAVAAGVPADANVDSYERVDATHFYLSFAANTVVPGLGTVQDEDVVYFNGDTDTWSVFFDGTAHSMARGTRDLDAIGVVGGTLYFSTVGNSGPPGITGPRDNADIYSWNGTSYARVWDATASGVDITENVDGLTVVDATHLYLSFTNGLTLAGVGGAQDEDVLYFNAGTWSVYFDGTAQGLTAGPADLDAIDVP